MPVHHGWDDEAQTIYTFTMTDSWTWGDFQEALREGYPIIQAADYAVDVIYAYISPLPQENAVQYLMLAGETQPSNCQHTVIVTQQALIHEIVKSVDSVRKWEGPAFFEDLHEARVYLLAQR
ncbi:MAG: hypothetical protein ACFE0Q_01590 [Anaerolineae bacterium]